MSNINTQSWPEPPSALKGPEPLLPCPCSMYDSLMAAEPVYPSGVRSFICPGGEHTRQITTDGADYKFSRSLKPLRNTVRLSHRSADSIIRVVWGIITLPKIWLTGGQLGLDRNNPHRSEDGRDYLSHTRFIPCKLPTRRIPFLDTGRYPPVRHGRCKEIFAYLFEEPKDGIGAHAGSPSQGQRT